MSKTPKKNAERTQPLNVILGRPEHYRPFMMALQDVLFAKIANNDIFAITKLEMLDMKSFKALEKEAYTEGLQDGYASTSSEDDHRDFLSKNELIDKKKRCRARKPSSDPKKFSEAYLTTCHDKALSTGKGFKEWVYAVYLIIKTSLSPEVAEQVSGCRRGDIHGILQDLRISMGYVEELDSAALHLEFVQVSMENEDANDLMKYFGYLKFCIKRLSTTDDPVTDAVAQRVALRGLHQEVFEHFILQADSSPHESFDKLEQALKLHCSRPIMQKRLASIRPGRALSVHTTSVVITPKTKQINDLRRALEKASKGGGKGNARSEAISKGLCFAFQKSGNCARGKDCKFAHASPEQPVRAPSAGNPAKFCKYHNRTGHSTEECKDKPAQVHSTEVYSTADYDDKDFECYTLQLLGKDPQAPPLPTLGLDVNRPIKNAHRAWFRPPMMNTRVACVELGLKQSRAWLRLRIPALRLRIPTLKFWRPMTAVLGGLQCNFNLCKIDCRRTQLKSRSGRSSASGGEVQLRSSVAWS